MRKQERSILCALLIFLLWASPTLAEEPPPRTFELDAEYRVRNMHLRPWELSGTEIGSATWTQQRLRVDAITRQEGVGAIILQLDILDGVIFGDNGAFGKDPSSISGVSLAAKRPNNSVWEMGLIPGKDPLDPDSYGPSLKAAEPIHVNHAYGEILLPIGVLKVGRQPLADGDQISAHDGGRQNRWGVSSYSDTADRILFGTKISEIYRALRDGKDYVPDRSLDNGVFWGVFYDWMNQGSIFKLKDDLGQSGGALMFKQAEADWFGWDWSELLVFLRAVHLQNDQFESDVWAFPCRAEASVNNWKLTLQGGYIYGHSREISEGFAALASSEPTRQKIQGMGAQAILDWKIGPATLTMEADYATGDDDPRSQTPITSFTFARDLNVGLLLFEHILAFESARSVAVGIENLSSLDAASFPLTEAQTDGRFTNAIALFPQLKLDWVDTHEHQFHTRFGVLFAWPEADGGAVDPIRTILADDGLEISDDAKNFHGGDPGDYYGTEYDIQLQWTFRDRFIWSLEGAFLVPGSSLEDEHFQATPSFMMENRFLFLF